MKKIGIFYGSTTGKTEAIVEEIEFNLKGEEFEIFNVKDGIDTMASFDNLIFVTPTYGVGELQDDWLNVLPELQKINFENKVIGLVGLGNQLAFGETFVGAMRTLYNIIINSNGKVIGFTSSSGYKHKESHAEINKNFVGLVLDEENDQDETPDRIKNWINTIKKDFF